MPRLIDETKQFDYRDEQEFNKHRAEMSDRGWVCIKHYIVDDGKWQYTAQYERGVLYNGVNGRGNR